MVVSSGNGIVLATSDPHSQLAVPSGNYVVLATSDASSRRVVPSGNYAVLDASLPGNSPRKLRNPFQVAHHATQPAPLKNYKNLVVQTLLTVHSKNCMEHACLAFLQLGLSLPKFAELCFLVKPNLVDSHCRRRLHVSINQ